MPSYIQEHRRIYAGLIAEGDLSSHDGDPFDGFLSGETAPASRERVASSAPSGIGAPLPPATQVPTGTRVCLEGSRLVRACYAVPPPEGVCGTVVRVRHAGVDSNHEGGYLFVRWDDGSLVPVLSAHLRRAQSDQAVSGSVRLASSSLDDFLTQSRFAKAGDDLVHTASHDLWAVKASEDGSVVVERLFDLDGKPLRV